MSSSDFLQQQIRLSNRIAVMIGLTGEFCGAMAEGWALADAEVVLVGRNPAKAEARLKKIASARGKAWFRAAEAPVVMMLRRCLPPWSDTLGALTSSSQCGRHIHQ